MLGRAVALAVALWLLPAGIAAAAAGIDETYVKPGGGNWGSDIYRRIFGSDEFGKSYALVIGVGDYTGYPDLMAPTNDAVRVRDFLIHDAGFDEVVTLTDDKATFERINGLMEDEFPAKLTARDRFLFYFSGHGETRTLGGGGKRGYLVLPPAPRRGWSRMIDMPKVRLWSANVGGARQSLFILDACFSGLVGFEPKGPPPPDGGQTLERLRQPAHHLLTAGDEGEQSYGADGQSLFTEAFLRAAAGEGDLTGDGLVSLHELVVHVGKLIDQRRRELEDKIKMTPRAWLARTEDNSGEFFFVSRARRDQAPAEARAVGGKVEDKGSGPPPFDARQLDHSFWDAIKDSRKRSDFGAYLRSFPEGIYAYLARSRLEDLTAGAAASSAAEPPETIPAPAPPTAPSSPAEVEAALGLGREDWRLQDALTAKSPVIEPAAPDRALEVELWRSAERRKRPAAYEAYRSRFCPGGVFCALAGEALARPAVAPRAGASPLGDRRCQRVTERAQLGEPLSDEERTLLRERCRS